MAEYDKGRLYWIKLTDRFISSDTVDFLMEQKDGANYVVLYQMLCLKTVNNGGVLARELGEILVPYEVEKIQRDCKWFSIDTVRVALELYKKLGLVYVNNDGILAISDFDRLIGSQTYGAEKKELQKKRKESNLLQGGQKVENFPPYKEKDIDIDKDKDKEKKKKKESSYEGILDSHYIFNDLRDLYLEYIKMRKMIKAPMTDRALNMLINKVNELEPNSIDNQKKLLETAIMNNWKSVYPLRDAGKPKQDKQPSKQEEELLKMFGG